MRSARSVSGRRSCRLKASLRVIPLLAGAGASREASGYTARRSVSGGTRQAHREKSQITGNCVTSRAV